MKRCCRLHTSRNSLLGCNSGAHYGALTFVLGATLLVLGIAVSFTVSTKMHFFNIWFLINKTPADAKLKEDPVAVLPGHKQDST